MRLGPQFNDEMLSRTQVYDWNNLFKEGQTEVDKMQRFHLPKGKLWPAFIGTLKMSYLLSDRKLNHQCRLLFEAC
jgi:hypothetical protein